MSADETFPPFDAKGEIARLVREGKAEELLWAWSEHSQSCSYVRSIVQHVADGGAEAAVSAQEFARNLLDDWSK